MNIGKIKINFRYRLKKVLVYAFFCGFSTSIFSQDPIKVTGEIMTGDSVVVPYVNIIILNRYKGTIADRYGKFSFVCNENDTLIFSRIGFKSKYYIVPETNETEVKKVVIMERDTVYLKEVTVLPWKNYEEFKHAVLTTNPPQTAKEKAENNLNLMALQMWYEDEVLDIPNATAAYKNYLYKEFVSPMYYRGQLMPNPLTNIVAWYKLIKAINEGWFKKNKYRKERIEWEEFLENQQTK